MFARSSFTQPGFIHKSVILYDGPFQIHNTDFYNFRQDFDSSGKIIPGSDIPLEVIGGHEKLTNLTSGLRFINSVNLKVKMNNSKGDKSPESGITSNLKDLDGTLAGRNNGAVFVGNYGFGTYLGSNEGCTTSSEFPGFKICLKEMATGTLRVARSKYDASLVSYVRRSDGIESLTSSDFNLMNLPKGDECWFPDHNAPTPSTCGFPGNTKTLLPDPHKHQYEVLLYDQNERPNEISFQYFNPNGRDVSPVFKIDIKRQGCNLNNANQKFNTNSFNSSNESAFYVEGSVIYFKINATEKFWAIGNSSEIKSNETVGEVILRCP